MVAKKYIVPALVIMALTFNLSACNFKSQKSDTSAATAVSSADGQSVSAQDDTAAKKAIEGYFTKMYSSADKFYPNNGSGNIPSELKDFIAQRALKENDGNPENGLHYPRIVEINGLNIVQYEAEKKNNNIQASFLTKSGDRYVYFVKIPLSGKCLDNNTFNTYYKESPDHIFSYAGIVDNSLYEIVHLIAKYEVELVKENNKFKILEAKESSEKKGYAHRLSKANNDFIERVPYLLIDSTVGNKFKAVDADKKVYESEKKVIEGFFTIIKGIDRTRMNMIGKVWNTDENAVSGVINKFDLPKYDALKGKKLVDLMVMDKDYKKRYELLSLPLQTDMDSIAQIKSISVLPHQSYSNKKKRYIVNVDASVHKGSGVLDSTVNYKYSYYVELTLGGDKLDQLRLQECFKVN